MPNTRGANYQPPVRQPPSWQASAVVRRLVVGLMLGAGVCSMGRAQAIRTWSFPLQHGTLSVSLLHGPGDRLVLSFGSLPCGACAAMTEMQRALRDALGQMRAAGLDPHRLTMIEARVSEPEAQKALAEAALRSPEWRACMKKAACGGEGLMVKLLNESQAFAPLEDALKPYGLTLRVASAEKISVGRASGIAGIALPAGAKGTMRVPLDGSLELVVETRK